MTNDRGNQARVRLTLEERRILLDRFRLSSELRSELMSASQNSADVWMTTDEADDLRDQAADLFQIIGLDAALKPTADGKLLDSLIDKLFTG